MTGRICVRVEHSTRVPFPATRRKHPGARGLGEVSLKSEGASRDRLGSRAFGGVAESGTRVECSTRSCTGASLHLRDAASLAALRAAQGDRIWKSTPSRAEGPP